MIEGFIRKKGSGTVIDIIVTTGARGAGISGIDDWRNRLVVRVREKPVGGRANAAIVRLFANRLGVPQGRVRIVSGHRSTQKTLEIGMGIEEVTSALKKYSAKVESQY